MNVAGSPPHLGGQLFAGEFKRIRWGLEGQTPGQK
jgi:hypothetical protein